MIHTARISSPAHSILFCVGIDAAGQEQGWPQHELAKLALITNTTRVRTASPRLKHAQTDREICTAYQRGKLGAVRGHHLRQRPTVRSLHSLGITIHAGNFVDPMTGQRPTDTVLLQIKHIPIPVLASGVVFVEADDLGV